MSYVDYPTTAGNRSVEDQLATINQYLYRLADTINHNIDTEGADNLLEKALKYIETENDSNSDPTAAAGLTAATASYDKAVSMYKSLKSMIISTATKTYTSETEPIINLFTSEYKAVSDKFGTIDEKINTSVEDSVSGLGISSMKEEIITAKGSAADALAAAGAAQSSADGAKSAADAAADAAGDAQDTANTIKTTYDGYIKLGWVDEDNDVWGLDVGCNTDTVTIGSKTIKGPDNKHYVRVTPTDIQFVYTDSNSVDNVLAKMSSSELWFPNANIEGGTLKIGPYTSDDATDYYFKVDKDGALTATKANIKGAITATSLKLEGTKLNYNTDIDNLPDIPEGADLTGYYKVGNTIKENFTVSEEGLLTANNAIITGEIIATKLTLASDIKLNDNIDSETLLDGYAKVTDIPASPDLTYYIKAEDGKVYDGEDDDGNYSKISVSSKGLLTAENAVISGKIVASSGNIGGFQILSSKNVTGTFLRYRYAEASVLGDDLTFYLMPGGYTGSVSLAGSKKQNGWVMAIGSYFAVDGSGNLYAQNAHITGEITATSLTLGDDANVAYSKLTGKPDLTVYISKDNTVTDDAKSASFKVSSAGLLTASNAVVSGAITATSGKIGDFKITSGDTVTGNFMKYAADSKLLGDDDTFYLMPQGTNSTNKKTFPGSDAVSGWVMAIGSHFAVNHNGGLYCDAVHVTGGITATSGNIGGFEILTSNNVRGTFMRYKPDNVDSFDDTTFYLMPGGYNSDTGISIAGSAKANNWVMTIGSHFGVNRAGGLYCSAVHITGGDLNIGGNFGITKEGAVTASNITVTGGSINIMGAFKVDATGVCRAYAMTCYKSYVENNLYINDNLCLYVGAESSVSSSDSTKYPIILQYAGSAVHFGLDGFDHVFHGDSIVVNGVIRKKCGSENRTLLSYQNSAVYLGHSLENLNIDGNSINIMLANGKYVNITTLYNKVYGTSIS